MSHKKISPKSIQDIYALGPMQEGMLFHFQLEEGSEQYFEQMSLSLAGMLNLTYFKQAWEFVIVTNPALRTVFSWGKLQRPVQIVLKNLELALQVLDFSMMESMEQQARLEDAKVSARQATFDLRTGPLFRLILCKLAENRYELIISNHHIILDGWSNGIILKEFFTAYECLQRGQALHQPVKSTFKDYISWYTKQDNTACLQYWRKYLQDFSVKTALPVDLPASQQFSHVEKASLSLQPVLANHLSRLSSEQRITLGSIFYTAWGILLQKYTNSDDVVFGATVSGRAVDLPGVENIVGMLINTVPQRFRANGSERLEDIMQRVWEETQQNQCFAAIPLVEIRACSELGSHASLFDSLVVVENYPLTGLTGESELKITSVSMFEMTNYELMLEITTFDNMELTLVYNPDAFRRETIELLLIHYECILTEIAAHPKMNLAELQLLSAAEKEKIAGVFNATRVAYPAESTLISLFAESVKRTPEQIALVMGNCSLTYEEFSAKVDELAWTLVTKGVQPGQIVSILAERSLEMVVGIYAISKAGGCYLPIDPRFPRERIEYMLKDSGCHFMLTVGECLVQLDFHGEIINLLAAEAFSPGSGELAVKVQPEDLAYIIYTSGSTGQPKGVAVEHRNVVNTLRSLSDTYRFTATDCYLFKTAYTFDVSVAEIFGWFLGNGRLGILAPGDEKDPRAIVSAIAEYGVTHINFAPSMFNIFVQSLAEADVEIINRLKYIFVAGEAFPTNLRERFYRLTAGVALVNLYGPTEAAIYATGYSLAPTDKSTVIPIGKPLANTQIHIVDRYGNMQGIGVPGEVWIAGAGVAREYLNKPELTAKRFIPDTFNRDQRMYRTGDLARWLPDGNIEFMGRMDHQVKIRGYRIELGEIENRLGQHPDISEAVVVDRLDRAGERYLAAYVVGKAAIHAAEVKAFLLAHLPEYMVPMFIVQLDSLPLNTSGKVDRRAFPEPDARLLGGQEYIAPVTQIESQLADIWVEILGVEQISRTDNFFELGGHSLKATQLATRLLRDLDVEIPLKKIFQHPVLQDMANLVEQAQRKQYRAIARLAESEAYPVSAAQKRLYILNQADPASTSYNMPGAIIIEGKVDLHRLHGVFQKMLARHETLRTTFALREGEVFQQIHPEVNFSITHLNLGNLDEEELNARIAAFVRPFDLSAAPLLRVELLTISDGKHILLFDMHHIISDGTSIAVFIRDFTGFYAGNDLDGLSIQYKDFAAWQNALLASEQIRVDEEFWLQQFADEVPVLNLLTDFSRPQTRTYAGDTVHCTLSEPLVEGVHRLATLEGVTPFMVLLAAFNVLLAKCTGQDDLVVGTPVAGRNHPDVENLLGMFVNTLALRNKPGLAQTFRAFLHQIKENVLSAYEHQNYQFDRLIDKLDLPRQLNRNPLFDVMLALQNHTVAALELPGLQLSLYPVSNQKCKFDLTLFATQGDGVFDLDFEYSTELFQKVTVERVAGYFTNVLTQVTQEATVKLADIGLASPEEKRQILIKWNGEPVEYPREKTIQELFEAEVMRTPDKPAVVFEDKILTYAELNTRANQLARLLRERGVQRDEAVGILTTASLEVITGILAIIKAGGAYLPIDIDYPKSRIEYIVQNASVRFLLVQNEVSDINYSGEIINLTDTSLYTGETGNLEICNKPSDLIYVIYTSGSTGQPKGVMIEHCNVNRLISNSNMLQISPADRILQSGSLAFDASTFEIWGSLLNGATLYMINKTDRLSAAILENNIIANGITQLWLTAPLFNQLLEIRPTMFKSLCKLYVGGDVLSPKHINTVRALHPQLKVINGYGPTESTTFTTYFPVEQEYSTSIPIGKPVSNTRVYILDSTLAIVPTGIPGELYIAGDGLARGYLGAPELTAEKFISDPFYPGERMYKSGDKARWLADGTIEFLGRMDYQVKIRGFRIELPEIEQHIARYPQVKQNVVVDLMDAKGVKYLAAYLVSAGEISLVELRSFLSKSLPDYMIPSYFVELPQIPLNANGKVNRQALPAPEGQVISGVPYTPPRNPLEEQLAAIWAEILGVNSVGIHDNFFELGGHSLKATGLVGKVHQVLEVEVPLAQIFQTPTIAELGEYIETAARSDYAAIEQVAEQDWYATSSAQKRVYMLQQFDLASTAYNIPGMFVADGALELDRVEQTLQALIRRHETLRTSFAAVGEQIVQQVHPEVDFALELLRLEEGVIGQKALVEQSGAEQRTDAPVKKAPVAQCSASSAQGITTQTSEDTVSLSARARQAITQFMRPFDLTHAPLFRVGVAELGTDQHLLFFDMHHIISDGTSMAVLINEFADIYAGNDLVPLRIQYKDYAAWQNQLMKSAALQRQAEYWQSRFSDEVPVLNLPADFKRSPLETNVGAVLNTCLDRELTARLKEFANQSGTTLYMLLLGGLNLLLSRYCGQEEIIVGSPIAGRPHAELQHLIGMFVNTLAMRNTVTGSMSFSELLHHVKENALQAYAHQDYPFETLVEQLDLQRDLGRNPLFDVMFTMQNMERGQLQLDGVRFTPYQYANPVAKFDLTWFASEVGEEISLDVEYSSHLFRAETVWQMVSHFENILRVVLANPLEKISKVEMLTAEEKTQLLDIFNQTAVDYPHDRTVSQLFAEQALRTPDNTAVVYLEQRMTYRELNERADALAMLLRTRGVQEESIVGIMAERSLAMIVGIVAILKAGGAYLPVDPDYPVDRIKLMLADCQVQILLTQDNAEAIVQTECTKPETSLDCELINLLDERIYTHCHQEHPFDGAAIPRSLAYVIYTSGSTGRPKGVMVEHRSIVRLVQNPDYVEFRPGDRILQTGTVAFDASTFEIWGALTNGLELHLTPKDIILSPDQMDHYLNDNGITTIFLTTSLFNLFADERPEMFRSLTYVLIGGEMISLKHIHKVQKACPDLKLVNVYGPTENTTFSTSFRIHEHGAQLIPIGKPIHNSTAFIVDRYNHICPIGVYGELCVGGDGLARGYLRNPELTAEKFAENPYKPGERMYRTGDLARWLSDGNIDFLGRIDHQVKIRGFRIEPGEIEKCLLQHEQIEEAIVLDRVDTGGNRYLCAYWVGKKGSVGEGAEMVPLETAKIRAFLTETLPDYMIPAYFVQLERMPLNRNGKIDRTALPEPTETSAGTVTYAPPRNLLEEQLAKIWSEVLGVQLVGIDDNFFELGGHSLRATILTSKIQQALQVELPLREVFKRPTIGELATYIQSLKVSRPMAIRRVEEREYYPASSAQKRLYLQDQLEGSGISYNMPGVLMVEGELRADRVEEAFRQLIERHETLRTSFALLEGEVVQKIVANADFRVQLLQVREDEIPALIKRLIRPFDLGKAPLLRVALAETAPQKHILIIDMHHSISDGMSLGVLVREFVSLYEGRKLSPLAIQYRDFAVWQRELVENGVMQKQEQYWLETFAGEVPVLTLPTDYPRPPVQSFEGGHLTLPLDAGLTKRLNSLAQATESTLYMVLLSAYNILLARYSGQEDIVVGTPAAGRRHADLLGLIGMLVNTLALRNRPGGEKAYLAFLQEVRENAIQAYENQDYQFEELLELLHLQRDLSRNPLFDVMLAVQNMDIEPLHLQDATFAPYPYDLGMAKFDLTATISEDGDALLLDLNYASRLFSRETVERMGRHLIRILGEVAAEPGVRLREIQMLSAAEKDMLLNDFNNAVLDVPTDRVIATQFTEVAERLADHPAVVCGGEALTYDELNRKANRLAHWLQAQGVRPDQVVGILLERSLEMIIAIMGVLKAGGAYMPVSPEYPRERKQYMLADSGARILLTQRDLLDSECSGIIQVDLLEEEFAEWPETNPGQGSESQNLAYVIYTSGSTGKPKGVMIEQRSVLNLVHGLWDLIYAHHASQLRVALVAPYYFDASVQQIFACLLGGHTLYIVPEEARLEGRRLLAFYRENRIDLSDGTPTHLTLLVNTAAAVDGGLLVQHLIIGGEALPAKTVEAFYTRFSDCRAFITNIYGPTECCVDSTAYLIDPAAYTPLLSIPVGRMMPNVKGYILGKGLILQPVGVPGELYISGVGVGRGYVNNPALTAERFVDDPFQPGKKMYRTGDLVRWLPGGNIDFLGRTDYQVKVRGFRIELGEIESRLLEYESVHEAVVVALEDQSGSSYLCAYFVAEQELSVGELRAYLLTVLPEYMLPAYYIQLEQMPLTANGKVNRKALPEPDGQMVTGNRYIAPANAVEARLAALWEELLGVKPVGVEDHFFELGGNSLKAMFLVSQIQREFQVELAVRAIFQRPTVRSLAECITGASVSRHYAIEPVEEREYYPVSSAQKRIYIQNQFDREGISYNMPGAVLLEGLLDRTRLEQAFRQLVERHETLRTVFVMRDEEIVQIVRSEVDLAISYHEIREDAIGSILSGFVRPFMLDTAPLLRVAVVCIAADRHLLCFDMHHIISDGVSMEILVRELVALYQGRELVPLRIQYKDFAVWQNQGFRTGARAEAESYWLATFAGAVPMLSLPTDYQRPPVQSYRGSRLECELPRELAAALKVLAVETGTTLYMVLLAVYSLLLARYSGQEDLVVGSPVAGRQHADLQNVLGMFVNMLALRNAPESRKSFREFLLEVKENSLQALEHQDYPFEELVERLQVKRDLSHSPLFDVVFSLQDARVISQIEGPGELRIIPYELESNVAKYDLTLEVTEEVGRMLMSIEYCTDLFKRETVERVKGHYMQMLQEVTLKPDLLLAQVRMLTDAERSQLLEEFNATEMEFPQEQTLHELIARQVARTPERVALIGDVETLTYNELDCQANHLARRLRELGVVREEIVALLAERSVDLLVAILAVLKAGGAYLPVDPAYPAERIAYMLEDSGARVLLATPELAKRIAIAGGKSECAVAAERSGDMGNPGNGCRVDESFCDSELAQQAGMEARCDVHDAEHVAEKETLHNTVEISRNAVKEIRHSEDGKVLCTTGLAKHDAGKVLYTGTLLDLSERTTYTGDALALVNINMSSDLAYIMYTSGSTGKPKGVMIEHRSVVSLAAYYNQMFKLDQAKNILHMSNVAFDTAVVEIFPPLIYGSTVHIIRKELALDRKGLLQYIRVNNINFAQFVPLTLQAILGESERPECLESVIVGSDKLDDAVKDQILSCGYRLTNHYGPTENTVDALVAVCEPGVSTIGKPIANTRVYILDNDGNPAPIGVPGELCLAGAGLARGYLNRPDLTEERFVALPWNPAERIYRTGDLAAWRSDGQITFRGRIDNQVKIRGYRIELGEIEQHLLGCEGVANAVVVDRVDASGSKYLCAYVVGAEVGIEERDMSCELDFVRIRAELAKVLPEYMIPAYLMRIERIPLTHNGKVDRRALPEPDGVVDGGADYVAAGSEVEERLVAIWEKVLAREGIGVTHNFFELGGHSLKAVQVVNLVHQELDVQLVLQDIFTAPTVRELALLVQGRAKTAFNAIEVLPEQEYYELSYNQKRLWIISQLEGTSRAYNLPGRVTFEESAEEILIKRIFSQLVARHESLRTQLKIIAGEPVQVITDGSGCKLQIFDLQNVSDLERECEREAIYHRITGEPFIMVDSPLLRTALVKVTPEQFEIIFCMHHIISDGWSLEILKREFEQFYRAGQVRQAFEPAPLTVQYKDFAAWQNQLIADSVRNKQAHEYWMEKLRHGFPVLNLPQDYLTGQLENRKSAAYRTVIPVELQNRLKELAQEHNTSLFAVLVATFHLFLADLTGQENLAIGVPSSGRQHQDLSNVIGFFINTLVLVNRVPQGVSLVEVLLLIQEDLLKALQYQDYPLELVTDELKMSYPKIQIFFNLLNMGESQLDTLANLESWHLTDVQEVKFDLTFYLTEYANGIEVICTYLTGLFKPVTVEYIVGEYIRLMAQLLGCGEESVDEDDLLIL